MNWAAHLHAIYVFALPNALIIAAILFAIAVLARNEVVPFIGALVLLIGYIVAGTLLQDLRHEEYVVFADPFGIRTFALMAKYWTVAEKNSVPVSLSGWMLWNRLLWALVAAAIFAFAYFRFSFSEKASKAKPAEADSQAQPIAVGRPVVDPSLQFNAWKQLFQSLGIHLRGMLVSIPFIIIMLAGGVNCLVGLMFNATEGYGNHTLPVTYWVLDLIRGTLYLFVIDGDYFYAGVLVWKDRDERMDEIVDATPMPEWISYATRLADIGCDGDADPERCAAQRCCGAGMAWLSPFSARPVSYELLVRDLFAVYVLAGIGIPHPRSLTQQVHGLLFLYRIPSGQYLYMAADERRDKPGPVRRHS